MCKICDHNVDDFWLDRVRHEAIHDPVTPESAQRVWRNTFGRSTPASLILPGVERDAAIERLIR